MTIESSVIKLTYKNFEMEETQTIEEMQIQQKVENVSASIKTKIEGILNDEKFLESLLPMVETPEDFMNFCKSIMNINKKISDSIHLIQDLSILSSSSRSTSASAIIQIGIFMRHLRITLPWGTSDSKRVISSLLQDLENVATKCISLNNELIHLSNQSEWDSNEVIKDAEMRITDVTGDNQDSILILRHLVDWDYDNGLTVGPSGKVTSSPKSWTLPWDSIVSPQRREQNRFKIVRESILGQKTESNDLSLLQRFKRPFLGIISLIALISVSLMFLFSKGRA